MSLFGIFHLYGLILGVGVAIGVWVIGRASRFFGVSASWLDSALPPIIIGAIIGARLYHLATDWQLYTHASLLDMIAVWRGGVGFLGAIMGGGLGLWIWVRGNRIKTYASKLFEFFTYLYLLSFGIPIAQAIGRLGNYVNKELYGLPTNLPWGITIEGQKYHPLFLYEALLNCLLFGFLMWLAQRKKLVLGKGQYVSVYLFGYALIRFWLEFLRIKTARFDGVLGIFSIAQWVTLTLMILATILFWVRRHAPKKA